MGLVVESLPSTFVLIVLPPTAGAWVAWATPPVGPGCRSLSFICYAGCQVVLTAFATIKASTNASDKDHPVTRWIFSGWRFWAVSSLCLLGSLFAIIAGTMMQLMGTYRNCFCYVNAQHWYYLDTQTVSIASDTAGQRASSKNWISMGIVATGFMGVTCYLAWWYQRLLRHRFGDQVEAIYDADLGHLGPGHTGSHTVTTHGAHIATDNSTPASTDYATIPLNNRAQCTTNERQLLAMPMDNYPSYGDALSEPTHNGRDDWSRSYLSGEQDTTEEPGFT